MEMKIFDRIDQLAGERDLGDEELKSTYLCLKKMAEDTDPLAIIRILRQRQAFGRTFSGEEERGKDNPLIYLFEKAKAQKEDVYGQDIYLRGLIEITNYCKNDCYYCGIRKGNRQAKRYRLTKEDILSCAAEGYRLGFRTFVLQGGEDPWYTDDRICDLLAALRKLYPECALTLSIGEKSRESYQSYFDAGADRYLLRHETANAAHYGMLHPASLSLENRKRCLFDLKEIGYQVGCGIMVGSPGQTPDHILEDIRFMQTLDPHMIGIGPFIAHRDTPFKDYPSGTLMDTILLLALLRLIFPHVLLPATTALGTIHPMGRELGFMAGANVVMPNLSPMDVRGKYELYQGKSKAADEASAFCRSLKEREKDFGFKLSMSRGDYR